MDPYLRVVKYVFEKNNVENTDDSIDKFFETGVSFPQFVALLFDVEKIPGIINSPNIFQKANNNTKAYSYIGQKIPFFKSFEVDFKNHKNLISLINLIMNKIYFKTNRTSFLKKCNDFLKPFNLNISSISELTSGIGFMKLINVVSHNSIPADINYDNKDQLIDQLTNYLVSLKIPVIIDKTALLIENQDILLYQALIIIDNNSNTESQKPIESLDISSEPLHYTQQNINTSSNELNEKKNDKLENKKQDNEQLAIENTKIIDDDQIQKNDQIIISSPILDNEAIKSTNEIIEIKDQKNENDKNIYFNNDKNDDSTISKSSESEITLSQSSIFESSEINFQKSSYLNIVNNLMENNKLSGILFFSEFENGIILPNLVQVLLKEKIPDIVDNPEGHDQLMNNMSALYFINQKDHSINPRHFILSKEDDIKDLIRVLLKKFVFTNELVEQMKSDCNSILHNFERKITNFNKDWSDGINFFALLSFLSNNEIRFSPDKNVDIDTLKDSFIKTMCPEVIEADSLYDNVDEFVVLYQIKIIFDEMSKRAIVIPKVNNNHDITVFDEIIEKNQQNMHCINNKNVEKDKIQENSNDKNVYIYVKSSNPLLRVLNIIGEKINLHYNSLDDVMDGLTLDELVKYLMNVPNIPGIKKQKIFEKMNINAIINFLRDSNQIFKYSSLDFNDNAKRTENIKWFLVTLLKQYFLKGNKQEFAAKVSEWIGFNIMIKDIKNIFMFGNGFYKMLVNHNAQYKNYYDEDSLLAAFQNVKVPFILDEESLTNVNDDYVCFQLQIIFNHHSKPWINDQNELDNYELESKSIKEDTDIMNDENSSKEKESGIQKMNVEKKEQDENAGINLKKQLQQDKQTENEQNDHVRKNMENENEKSNEKDQINKSFVSLQREDEQFQNSREEEFINSKFEDNKIIEIQNKNDENKLIQVENVKDDDKKHCLKKENMQLQNCNDKSESNENITKQIDTKSIDIPDNDELIQHDERTNRLIIKENEITQENEIIKENEMKNHNNQKQINCEDVESSKKDEIKIEYLKTYNDEKQTEPQDDIKEHEEKFLKTDYEENKVESQDDIAYEEKQIKTQDEKTDYDEMKNDTSNENIENNINEVHMNIDTETYYEEEQEENIVGEIQNNYNENEDIVQEDKPGKIIDEYPIKREYCYTTFIKKENKRKENVKYDDDPNSPYTSVLYSYAIDISNIKFLINEINSRFKEILAGLVQESAFYGKHIIDAKNKSKSEVEKEPIKDNIINSIKLFEYSTGKWTYNENEWLYLLKQCNIKKNDILYLILITPNCSDDYNFANNNVQTFIESFLKTKIRREPPLDMPYVDITLYDFKNIKQLYNIQDESLKNEFIGFIQILYPSSFKNSPVITNMQSYLAIQADYLLNLYPSIELEDSIRIINTAMHNATLCFYNNLRHIELGFILTNPELEMKELLQNQEFIKDIDFILNRDMEMKKLIKNQFVYNTTKLYCIDVDDDKTYYNLTKNILTAIYNKYGLNNKISHINKYWKYVINIGFIEDQIDMINIMHNISTTQMYLEEQKIILNLQNRREEYALFENDIDTCYTSKLYRYVTNIPDINEYNRAINDRFRIIFQETLEKVSQYKKEDLKKPECNFKKKNQKLKFYKLFDYKSNQWKKNNDMWNDFLKSNKLNNDFLLDLILLPPFCKGDKNELNDLYKMLCALTGYKIDEDYKSDNNDECYVELVFCGNVKNIEEQVGICLTPTKNEYLAFVQINYPKKFRKSSFITNMQTFLTYNLYYLLILNSTISIDDCLAYVNTAFHNILQSKNTSFLFTYTPIKPNDKQKDIIHSLLFGKTLDLSLNSDKELFKLIKKHFEYFYINISWIDLNDYQTYTHFFEEIIEFFNDVYRHKMKISDVTEILDEICHVNEINNQIDIANFFQNYTKKSKKENIEIYNKSDIPVFHFNSTKYSISYKSSVWNEFLQKNNIAENSSIFLVLICNSKSNDCIDILKIFTRTIDSVDQFHYCGLIEDINDVFKLKIKKANVAKSHLIFYCSDNYSSENDRLIEDLSIGLQCHSIITFLNEDYEKQLNYSNRLIKLLNIQLKKKNKITNVDSIDMIFLIRNNHYLYDGIDKSVGSMISWPHKKIAIEMTSQNSRSSFFSKIIENFPEAGNMLIDINNYFNKIEKITDYLFFYLIVFEKLHVNQKDFVYNQEHYDNISEKMINLIQHISPKFYSMSLINRYFIQLYYDAAQFDDFDTILDIIKEKVMKSYACLAQAYFQFPEKINELINDLVQTVEDYITNSVIFIEGDSYQMILESLLEKIKDNLYLYIKAHLPENISKDMIMHIYNLQEPLIIVEFFESIKKIKAIHDDIKKNKKKNEKMDQKQIEQNSMKYILAVKESFKEMTVEISCKDDLEAQIKQDF